MVGLKFAYHAFGSMNTKLLSRWLDDVNSDIIAGMTSSEISNSSERMRLALSQVRASHTSATILLHTGDREPFTEAFASRKLLVEAILLTCLVVSLDWQRQAHAV